MTTRTGRITERARRDLRAALVETAQSAANTHIFWKEELKRAHEPRLGHNKTIVAIGRRILVIIWHVLAEGATDHHAQPEIVARKFLQYVYKLGKENRPANQSTAAYGLSSARPVGDWCRVEGHSLWRQKETHSAATL